MAKSTRSGKRASGAGSGRQRTRKSGGSKAPGSRQPKLTKSAAPKQKPSRALNSVLLKSELRAARFETKEALERQTATAEILKVIASSPSDVQPVFKAIAQRSNRLVNGLSTAVYSIVDDVQHMVAFTPINPEADAALTAYFPAPLSRFIWGDTIRAGKIFRIADTEIEYDEPEMRNMARLRGWRSLVLVPLLRGNKAIGMISVTRKEPGSFATHHVQLLQTFADQAVIAIENARLFNEVQARTRDLTDSLQQQTATADVLKVISRSAFDLQTVLQTLVESAAKLCNASMANIRMRDGDVLRAHAFVGGPEHHKDYMRHHPVERGRGTVVGRAFLTGELVHVSDVLSDPEYENVEAIRVMGYRAVLAVPMVREGRVEGVFSLVRPEPIPFSDREIELVRTFADQAVIAIENVRLFNETQESLERQTVTADILKVIAASPADVQPVFDTIVASALRLCSANWSGVLLYDGETIELAALNNLSGSGDDEALRRRAHASFPRKLSEAGVTDRAISTKATCYIPDVARTPGYEHSTLAQFSRSVLSVPMLRDGLAVGAITVVSGVPDAFSERQQELLRTFADQAVIAIENTRLFNEVQAKTRDLAESLDQQIATGEVLKAISHSAFELQPVFDAIAENSVKLCHAERAFIFRFDGQFLRAISSFNVGPEVKRFVDQNPIALGRHSVSARAGIERRTVHVADVHADSEYAYAVRDVDLIRTILAVPMLKSDELVGVITIYRLEVMPFTDKQVSLVETFAAQAVIAVENTRLINELRQSLDDLRTAQDRLVQTEKLASLGQLTAGIAHEIKNPLNFVNNFSGMSAELIGELQDVVGGLAIEPEAHADIKELTDMLSANLGKIVQHGQRADAIVKSMLLHSGQSSGEHRPSDINALVDECLNRAYYGERAETRGFTIKLERSFDPDVGEVDLYPREISRAILNLISNGFYATSKRKETEGGDYEPVLVAATRNLGDRIEIRVRDNGSGIPAEVKEKMFDPFFTTKPAGEGTGLGLSITHDIIVKQHGGSIEVDTKPDEFAEIRVILPRAGALLSERK